MPFHDYRRGWRRALAFEGIDVLDVNDAGQIPTARAYGDPTPVLAALQG